MQNSKRRSIPGAGKLLSIMITGDNASQWEDVELPSIKSVRQPQETGDHRDKQEEGVSVHPASKSRESHMAAAWQSL